MRANTDLRIRFSGSVSCEDRRTRVLRVSASKQKVAKGALWTQMDLDVVGSCSCSAATERLCEFA